MLPHGVDPPDAQHQILKVLIKNYVSRGWFELASVLIQQLHCSDQQSAYQLLRNLLAQGAALECGTTRPNGPSHAHLAWLSLCELRKLASIPSGGETSATLTPAQTADVELQLLCQLAGAPRETEPLPEQQGQAGPQDTAGQLESSVRDTAQAASSSQTEMQGSTLATTGAPPHSVPIAAADSFSPADRQRLYQLCREVLGEAGSPHSQASSQRPDTDTSVAAASPATESSTACGAQALTAAPVAAEQATAHQPAAFSSPPGPKAQRGSPSSRRAGLAAQGKQEEPPSLASDGQTSSVSPTQPALQPSRATACEPGWLPDRDRALLWQLVCHQPFLLEHIVQNLLLQSKGASAGAQHLQTAVEMLHIKRLEQMLDGRQAVAEAECARMRYLGVAQGIEEATFAALLRRILQTLPSSKHACLYETVLASGSECLSQLLESANAQLLVEYYPGGVPDVLLELADMPMHSLEASGAGIESSAQLEAAADSLVDSTGVGAIAEQSGQHPGVDLKPTGNIAAAADPAMPASGAAATASVAQPEEAEVVPWGPSGLTAADSSALVQPDAVVSGPEQRLYHPTLFHIARLRNQDIAEETVRAALQAIMERDLDTAERLLKLQPALVPLVIAAAWDALVHTPPAKPAEPAAAAGPKVDAAAQSAPDPYSRWNGEVPAKGHSGADELEDAPREQQAAARQEQHPQQPWEGLKPKFYKELDSVQQAADGFQSRRELMRRLHRGVVDAYREELPRSTDVQLLVRLCDQLQYRLEIAEQVYHDQLREQASAADSASSSTAAGAAAQAALARLTKDSPLRVVHDLLPRLPDSEVLDLVSRQPPSMSDNSTDAPQHDSQLLHVVGALKSTLHVFAALLSSDEAGHSSHTDPEAALAAAALSHSIAEELKSIADDIEALTEPFLRLWLLNLIACLLQTDISWFSTLEASPSISRLASGPLAALPAGAFAAATDIPSAAATAEGTASQPGASSIRAEPDSSEAKPANKRAQTTLHEAKQCAAEAVAEGEEPMTAARSPGRFGLSSWATGAAAAAARALSRISPPGFALDASAEENAPAAGLAEEVLARLVGLMKQAVADASKGMVPHIPCKTPASSSSEPHAQDDGQLEAQQATWCAEMSRPAGQPQTAQAPAAAAESAAAASIAAGVTQEALAAHVQVLRAFVEEAEWRLALLRQMAPSIQRLPGRSESVWGFGEALTVMQARPEVLLDMCKLRSRYDLGDQAVRHFALPDSEASALVLAEWVESNMAAASVESAVSRVACQDEAPGDVDEEAPPLDFETLRAPLSTLLRLMLCLDVATSSAATSTMCQRLLKQAAGLLEELDAAEPDTSDVHAPALRAAAAWWLSMLQETCEAEGQLGLNRPLRDAIAGVDVLPVTEDTVKGDDRASVLKRQLLALDKALNLLTEALANAAEGKHQFLSGLLHNLARSTRCELNAKTADEVLQAAGAASGLATALAERSTDGQDALLPGADELPRNYLSNMLKYLAEVGDELASIDPAPSESINYFSLLQEHPQDLLPRLVVQMGCTEVAFRVAQLLGTDLVTEVLGACLEPVYPPGHTLVADAESQAVEDSAVNYSQPQPQQQHLPADIGWPVAGSAPAGAPPPSSTGQVTVPTAIKGLPKEAGGQVAEAVEQGAAEDPAAQAAVPDLPKPLNQWRQQTCSSTADAAPAQPSRRRPPAGRSQSSGDLSTRRLAATPEKGSGPGVAAAAAAAVAAADQQPGRGAAVTASQKRELLRLRSWSSGNLLNRVTKWAPSDGAAAPEGSGTKTMGMLLSGGDVQEGHTLQLAVLKQLAPASPFRVAVACVVALLQRAKKRAACGETLNPLPVAGESASHAAAQPFETQDWPATAGGEEGQKHQTQQQQGQRRVAHQDQQSSDAADGSPLAVRNSSGGTCQELASPAGPDRPTAADPAGSAGRLTEEARMDAEFLSFALELARKNLVLLRWILEVVRQEPLLTHLRLNSEVGLAGLEDLADPDHNPEHARQLRRQPSAETGPVSPRNKAAKPGQMAQNLSDTQLLSPVATSVLSQAGSSSGRSTPDLLIQPQLYTPQQQLQQLVEAGQWRMAIAYADRALHAGAPDWLLVRACTEMAELAAAGGARGNGVHADSMLPVVQTGTPGKAWQSVDGSTPARRITPARAASRAPLHHPAEEAAGLAAKFSWECCMRIRSLPQKADLVLRLVHHWELEDALLITEICRDQSAGHAVLDLGGQEPAAPAAGEEPAHIANQQCRQQRTDTSTAQPNGRLVGDGAAAVRAEDEQVADACERQHALHHSLAELGKLLGLYQAVLASPAGAEFRGWQQMHSLFHKDPEQLVRRLLAHNAGRGAADLAAQADIPDVLRHQAFALHMQQLFSQSSSEGGGVIGVIRQLQTLPPLSAALSGLRLIQLTPSLSHRQVIAQTIAGFADRLPAGVAARLELARTGIRTLSLLDSPWDARCAHLVERPRLMVECLVMGQQATMLQRVLKELPALHDDAMLLQYARLGVSFAAMHASDHFIGPAPVTPTPNTLQSAPQQAQQPQPAQPLAIGGRTSQDRSRAAAAAVMSPDSQNWFMDAEASLLSPPRLSSLLESPGPTTPGNLATPSERTPGNARGVDRKVQGLDGVLGDEAAGSAGQGAGLVAVEVLTGDAESDDRLRSSWTFRSAPNFKIARAFLSHSSSPQAAAQSAILIATELATARLHVDTAALEFSATAMEHMLEAASIVNEALAFAQDQLALVPKRKTPKEVRALVEKLRDSASELGKQTGLLQMLLEASVPASLAELCSAGAAGKLVGRLLAAEHYALAVFVAKRWELGEARCWEAWAYSLLAIGSYGQAENRLANALRPSSSKASTPEEFAQEAEGVALRAVAALEGTAPINIPDLGKLCDELQDALLAEEKAAMSADSYLEVLQVSNKLPRASEVAFGRPAESEVAGKRYEMGERLLREHAPGHLLRFMFKHGQAAAACQLLYPPVPAAGGKGGMPTGHTRLGTLEALCQLAVEFEEMRTLQRALSAAGPAGHAALRNVCTWLEQHGHLRHLYRCQLALRMPDAAGLTCLHLSWAADDLPSAVIHLENALLHLNDALAFLQRSGSGSAPQARDPVVALSGGSLAQAVTRVQLQADVYKSVQRAREAEERKRGRAAKQEAQAAPKPVQFNLFADGEGPDTAAETEERRQRILEFLIEKDFNLAFRIVHAFGINPIRAYSSTAASLASRREHTSLFQLLQSIRNTLAASELDSVLAAAVGGYASGMPAGGNTASSKFKGKAWAQNYLAGGGFSAAAPAERVIKMMQSSHSRVQAYLRLGLLPKALEAATASGSRVSLQLVAEEARRRQDIDTLAAADARLAQL